MLNPIGTKIISTARFILRPFNYDDVIPLFYNYGSKNEVTKFLNWEAYRNIDQAAMVVQNFVLSYSNPYYFNWAIVEKNTNALIGSISIHHLDNEHEIGELGICLNPQFWKRGIGFEVMKAVIDFGFKNIGIHRLEAKVHINNIGSNRLMNKLNMKFEGIMFDALKKNNLFYNLNLYSMIKSSDIYF